MALVLARSALVVGAVLLVAVPEATGLVLGGSAALSPFLGVALLLASELGLWSIDNREPCREGPRVSRVRGTRMLGVGAIGVLVGVGLLALSQLQLSGGALLTLAGVLAAIGLLALLGSAGREAMLGRWGGQSRS